MIVRLSYDAEQRFASFFGRIAFGEAETLTEAVRAARLEAEHAFPEARIVEHELRDASAEERERHEDRMRRCAQWLENNRRGRPNRRGVL